MIHYITATGIGNAWVANELRVVRRAEIPFVLHAMRGPQQRFFESEWAMDLLRGTRTIYPVPWYRLIGSFFAAPLSFGGRFFGALANALLGKRESLRCRVAALAHFLVACDWARRLRHENVSHIHAQWIHSCGTIGLYGAWLLGKPFSFTGHAADLFKDRVALEDKIRRADFIICISEFHRQFFKKLGARDEQLHIAYCGIDLEHFAPLPKASGAAGPLRILSSGRLVEKKGFKYLIEACKILAERGVDFHCTIGGSGPLERPLREQVAASGLGGRITITGQEITQDSLPQFMRQGDIYCLPCVWASDNDVDGLPQMLMEAMACGLPVISTRLVGIPDLVIHEKTGLLVEPNNSQQLADAIVRLKDDAELARQLAAAGRSWCYEKFDIWKSLEPLLDLYRAKLGMPLSNHAAEPQKAAEAVAVGVER